ncbi:hypothetical protein KSP40_PGU007147 [Platanthera guangdongensis]|uniref:RlpA-like protein double-psi beta-barrel domain-containing protein n=1 Tax=Platanthera guangdongensis TaxID=2320717 RepID=A0ABR2LVZ5_9ASPA
MHAASECFQEQPLDPNLFLISLGHRLWDNGRACGDLYDVTCLPQPGNQCVAHEGGSLTVRAKVVDRCKYCGHLDMLLSLEAYASIAKVFDGNGSIMVSFEKVIARQLAIAC